MLFSFCLPHEKKISCTWFEYFCRLQPLTISNSLTFCSLVKGSIHLPFPKRQILDFSKFKEFADNSLKCDEIAETSPNEEKTLWEKRKLLVTSNFSFSHSVFQRLILQTRKIRVCLGKGKTLIDEIQFWFNAMDLKK